MNIEPQNRRKVKEATRRRGGFTLVELLVVVSIIALLIAILLPSLKRARDQTKSVVCKANLRSMGQAFTMYAEKFNGVWPPAVDIYENENRWPVPFHQGGIITAQLAKFDDNGNLKSSPDSSIFICPSERAERIIPDWDNGSGPKPVDRVEVGGSYAINEEIHRRNGKLECGFFPPPTAVPPYLNKIDNCRRAAEVTAVVENYRPIEQPNTPGWRYNRGANETNGNFTAQGGGFYLGYRLFDGTPVPDNPAIEAKRIVGGRHQGKGNFLAIDTHSESYTPDKLAYNQVSWERWPNPNDTPPGGL